MNKKTRIRLLAPFFVLMCLFARAVQAAPVLVPSGRAPAFLGAPVVNLAAFVVEKNPPLKNPAEKKPEQQQAEIIKPEFVATRIALQIQELNSLNTLEFSGHSFVVEKNMLRPPPNSELPRLTSIHSDLGATFTRFHRMVLNEKEFTSCASDCLAAVKLLLKAQCAGENDPQILKMTLMWEPRVAFLVNCGLPVAPWVGTQAVEVSLGKRTLSSDLLRYTYSKKNHMLLQDFEVKKKDVRGVFQDRFISILHDSEMHLYAKPRYFFPLHFTGDDVRSEVSRVQIEPLSSAGQLTFFLDVLSFKISLNLLSEVSMFEDAIHVPVLLNLPVSGSILRPGSGVYYGFKFAQGMDLNSIKTDLPRLQSNDKPISFASTRTFAVENPDFSIAVGMHMPAEFEEMGFAPALALPADLAKRGFPEVQSDFGIFYDITHLRKGTHRFDLWFYVGKSEDAHKVQIFAKEGLRYSLESLTF